MYAECVNPEDLRSVSLAIRPELLERLEQLLMSTSARTRLCTHSSVLPVCIQCNRIYVATSIRSDHPCTSCSLPPYSFEMVRRPKSGVMASSEGHAINVDSGSISSVAMTVIPVSSRHQLCSAPACSDESSPCLSSSLSSNRPFDFLSHAMKCCPASRDMMYVGTQDKAGNIWSLHLRPPLCSPGTFRTLNLSMITLIDHCNPLVHPMHCLWSVVKDICRAICTMILHLRFLSLFVPDKRHPTSVRGRRCRC